jgi:uroporphyrinogen decarboxylase
MVWSGTRYYGECDEDKTLAHEYCIIGGMWPPFWHETQELFGLERMFEMMYDNPFLVEAAIERIVDFDYVISKEAFEANKGLIDIFWFANDFGTQHNLIMNPEMGRKFFKPGIRKHGRSSDSPAVLNGWTILFNYV